MRNLITLFVAAMMVLSTSCLVVVPNGSKKAPSNGKKKGWYKNRHNPHNPNTDNPGKGNGKHKNKFTRLDFQ